MNSWLILAVLVVVVAVVGTGRRRATRNESTESMRDCFVREAHTRAIDPELAAGPNQLQSAVRDEQQKGKL